MTVDLEKTKILLATGNAHKVEEIGEILGERKYLIKCLSDFPPFPEPVEDGATYEENAYKKAMHYFKLTGIPSIADDSGLEIEALGGKPGIYSARFINPSLNFDERNTIVLDLLKDVPSSKRKARFVCCSVLVLDDTAKIVKYGYLDGSIGYERKGEYGFGYDPIFYLPDRKKYLAELPSEEKNKINHRFNAFSIMKTAVEELLNQPNSAV